MPHQPGHTWGDLGMDAIDFGKNLFGLNQGGGGFLGSTGAGLLGAIGQAALGQQGIKDLAEARRGYQTQLRGDKYFGEMEGGILGELDRQTQFKPFTVTTGTGQQAVAKPTGLDLQLTQPERNLQNSLLGFSQEAFNILGSEDKREEEQTNLINMLTQTPEARRQQQTNLVNMLTSTPEARRQQQTGLINMLTQTPEQREQDQTSVINMLTQSPEARATREQQLFDRLEAMQEPGRERARLGLEERLVNQGRSGVRSAMFGGTPEELAQAKAIEEQRSRNVLGAMDQARAEQALGSQQTLQGLQEFRNRMNLGSQVTLQGLQEARAQEALDSQQTLQGLQESRAEQALGSQQTLQGLQELRGRLGLAGELGLRSIPAAYTPQAGLLSALNPMLQMNRNQVALDLGRGELFGGLAESGLEADLGIRALENALRQQQYKGLFDLLAAERSGQGGGTTTTTTSDGGNLFSNLIGQIRDFGAYPGATYP